MHLTRLNQSLENTSNVRRSFVCLVNYQHMSLFHSTDKRRILVDNHSFTHTRLQCQRLNSRIPEQLTTKALANNSSSYNSYNTIQQILNVED